MSVTVTQPEKPVAAEVIATAIVDIAKGMKAIESTRLTRNALVALIHDQSRVPKKTINVVLNNLVDLEKDWLKPTK